MAVMAMALMLLLPGQGAVGAGREDVNDPLAAAKAVADRELFGRVQSDDGERPAVAVHHDWLWEDATLMAGVFALYDRTVELGAPVPRYREYLEAWGAHDPGSVPIVHGDQVCAGQTYVWLYERSGRTSDHLARTDPMIAFLVKARGKPSQWFTPYHDYWMRFWQDDVHMIAPFLAQRGRAAGSDGIPNGKDARQIAIEYCRAYADVLGDPATGLYWHNPRAKGLYHWSRGNGWVAVGYYKVMKALEEDTAYAEDAAWLQDQLIAMAPTLKDNRNAVGTWNADVLDREEYRAPETSGSAFFTYMIAGMINSGYLGDEYLPVAQKAWNFLRLSVTDEGELMRVQPAGRGPIQLDFEMNSETYGVGGFLLAAVEMSKMPPAVLARADQVECIRLAPSELEFAPAGAMVSVAKLRNLRPDFPKDPAGRVQAVMAGQRLCPTVSDPASGIIGFCALPPDLDRDLFIFYQP